MFPSLWRKKLYFFFLLPMVFSLQCPNELQENIKNQTTTDNEIKKNMKDILKKIYLENEDNKKNKKNINILYVNKLLLEQIMTLMNSIKNKDKGDGLRTAGVFSNKHYFVKISEGFDAQNEGKNLEFLRNFFLRGKISGDLTKPTNSPYSIGATKTFRADGTNYIFNLPASLKIEEEGKIQTITLAFKAGTISALDFIKKNINMASDDDLEKIGEKLGTMVALMANEFGAAHGDLHLNNIRLEFYLPSSSNIKALHLIDLETAAWHSVSWKKTRTYDLLHDFLRILAVSFAQKAKNNPVNHICTLEEFKSNPKYKFLFHAMTKGFVQSLNNHNKKELQIAIKNFEHIKGLSEIKKDRKVKLTDNESKNGIFTANYWDAKFDLDGILDIFDSEELKKLDPLLSQGAVGELDKSNQNNEHWEILPAEESYSEISSMAKTLKTQNKKYKKKRHQKKNRKKNRKKNKKNM